MIEWDRRVRLRHYLEQGYTQLEIAERLGISRRTIYRWIRSGQLDRDLDEPPRYGLRPKQVRKLPGDPSERLHGRTYPAQRLCPRDPATPRGGSGDPVRDAAREAGRRGFAHFRLQWGRRYALLLLLGYSRQLWFQYVPRQVLPTLMSGLEAAFRFFEGVPEELLPDQMRSVIVRDLGPDGGAPLVTWRYERTQ